MHELSIAQGIVTACEEAARREGAPRVLAVRVRVGALSGVAPRALHFCYDVATRGTLLEGASLHIERVPISVYCSRCDRVRTAQDQTSLLCPTCGAACADLRSGLELEVTSIEVGDAAGDFAEGDRP